MPAKTEKQRRMMAIAEHNPSKLYGRNRSALSMTHSQLHDFASKPKSGDRQVKTTTKQPPLGSGARFSNLVSSLSNRGASDPKRLAAFIGQRKYGSKKMSKMAANNRKDK